MPIDPFRRSIARSLLRPLPVGLLALGLGLGLACTPRGSGSRGDDDDATGDDDDSATDDDDATGDDDDATGDDDDATGFVVVPGDVIVTEVMSNPAPVDDMDGEWIELRNLTSSPIDLSGWTLADRGTDSVVISPAGPLILPSGGYLVLGRDSASGVNGGVAVNWAYGNAFELANGGDEVVLLDASGGEIFGLDYTSLFPNPAGVSTIFPGAPAWPASELETNWCSAPASSPTYGLGDRGTPGSANGGC